MNKKSEEFLSVMLDFIPSSKDDYEKSIENNGEILETVIIEDIFMPKVLKLLVEETNTQLLKRIFNYFEEVSHSDDEHLLNTFSVTVLEVLGNDRVILEIAKKYMGTKTIQLQVEADKSLGRIDI
ncbi:MAG: resolvase [Anaerocolumna sp.]